MNFKQFGLHPSLQEALDDIGYETPTPIQQESMPAILEGRDVLGSAQTGTGKTAAFSLPLIQQLIETTDRNSKPRIKGLILSPTRELALQINDSIRDYTKHTKLRHTVIFGGVKKGKQISTLRRGVDILVATPGRLLDLMGEGFLSLADVDYFVLDEADRMLDMGFIHDIRKVIKKLPQQRQSLFFSATLPDNIVELSKQILTNPIRIEVNPTSTTAETVHQEIYYTNKSDKKNLLLHILETEDIDQGLIFTRTKHGADKVTRFLNKEGHNALAIHGNKSQNQRQSALKRFKSGEVELLVATDIASRGIDIDKLAFVINYEIPNEPETYVHRIGRSGRAGEEGRSISVSEPEENVYVREIEKLIDQKIDIVTDHPYPQTEKPMTDAEKKEFNKEKQRRKQEFFANRKKNKTRKGGSTNHSKPQKKRHHTTKKAHA